MPRVSIRALSMWFFSMQHIYKAKPQKQSIGTKLEIKVSKFYITKLDISTELNIM